MKTYLRIIAAGLCLLPLVSCNADNRGAKQGAAGGALVGLTMGALAGDSGMAMRGAAAGAVMGGVSGNMADLEATRAGERTERTAGAIENSGGGGSSAGAPPTPPATWDKLAGLPGNWDCTAWGLNDKGERVNATAVWAADQAGSQAVKMRLESIDLEGIDELTQGTISGYFQLSFSQKEGYELLTSFGGPDTRWVGEKVGNEERYRFYYVSGGKKDRDVWLDLRFLGTQVMVIETYTKGPNGDVVIQSYRFNRRG